MALRTSPIRECGIINGPLEAALLSAHDLCREEHGALTSFIGTVRNEHLGKDVTHLHYECYEPMAKAVLQSLIEETCALFDSDLQAKVFHGIGTMYPSQASVVIHVSSAHRVAAFDACRHIIERIKEDLPVWKQEFYSDGSHSWLKGS
jgi:molybdopterin synthase catalytic subunit